MEARAIADAVIEHARDCPQKTLGVGAFSVAQRDAILDELELRRRKENGLEQFFSTSGVEPFFVKNLENIQGDERDVIFISVGYGKDRSGYMAMNFGPLAKEGGERRLNVLITRARERCVVFSSITADDIDLNRARSRGAQALKTFLTYAKSGVRDAGQATGRDYDSEFERQVARALERCGHQVEPQVGAAGFFIDLAVIDPESPGRYLLGIECDGATYHSSRSARDRDRLRQQVLEDRGWIIHRIWSTDWFRRPDQELRKVLAEIENARAEWAKREVGEAPPTVQQEAVVRQEAIERAGVNDQQDRKRQAIETTPYVEAVFDPCTSDEIHEVPVEELAEIVTQIVEIEGPVHQDEIARRVAALWGLKRTGSRIAQAVTAATGDAARRGRIEQEGFFFSTPGQRLAGVRDRADACSFNLRKPEMLPPAEIRTAILTIVGTHLGVANDEVIVESARLFGFKSTSAQLREVISRELDNVQYQGLVDQRNGRLYQRHTEETATV